MATDARVKAEEGLLFPSPLSASSHLCLPPKELTLELPP